MNNYLKALKKFTNNEYEKIVTVFKKLKIGLMQKITLKVPEQKFRPEEITKAIENQMLIPKTEFKKLIVGKVNIVINIENKRENLEKIKEKTTNLKINDTDIIVTSSKWSNFVPKEKPNGFVKPSRIMPRYRVIFKGFMGTEKDMIMICKEFGDYRSIYHEKTLDIPNGTVFVEFNSLKDPMMMKIDLLTIPGLPMMFLKWYENGIRQIGFMQSMYEENSQLPAEDNEENQLAIENLKEDSEETQNMITKVVKRIEDKHSKDRQEKEKIDRNEISKEKVKQVENLNTKENEEKEKTIEKMNVDEENNKEKEMELEEQNTEEITIIEASEQNTTTPKIKKRKQRDSTPPADKIPSKKSLNKTPTDNEENKKQEELTPLISSKQGKLKQTTITQLSYERNQHNDS